MLHDGWRLWGAAFFALFVIGCGRPANDRAGGTGPMPEIGYVLHGQNEFTQIIKQGAEDAGAAEKVLVDVQGPASFLAADAIAMFEGMTQRRVEGLVVVPMPGEQWVTPLRQATAGGIPVVTANVSSPGSAATSWFGQDEHASGVVLAGELRKALAAANMPRGKIIVGICKPGVGVLEQRYQGLLQGFKETPYEVSKPYDVNTDSSTNYGAWENLAGANADVVAFVGLCSMDLPNLAKLKERKGGRWLIAGYDLGRETLNAIRSKHVQVALGQHPYLQGYLPVAALARHLRDKTPLPQGWIDVGTEIVTRENVDAIYDRETDTAAQKKWYADYIARHFADLSKLAKPLPSR